MAPLHALENLDDALDATTSFLRPVDRTMWLKLAVVAFFIGGPGANANSVQWTFGGGGGNGGGATPTGFVDPGIGGAEWLVIAAIFGFIITLALLFGLVGSVMEFVFIESLRRREIRIRTYWNERWRQGLRLFGFRFALGLFVLGSILLLAVPFLAGVFDVAAIGGGTAIAFFLVLLPVFIVLAFVVGLVNGFTTVFVVPIMLLEDSGVLAGWRRLWPTITANPLQYVAYLVASFFLGIVGGVLVAIVVAVLALVLLIPFGVLFAIGGAILAFVAESAGIAVLVVVGIAYALALVAVVALVQVPVQVYLRYYALLVLGDVDPDLDLIPDQRAEIRQTEPATEDVA
jgi:hypothetical protein